MAEDALLLASGCIILAMLAAYAYAVLSQPKGLFRTPREHAEIRSFRRMKSK